MSVPTYYTLIFPVLQITRARHATIFVAVHLRIFASLSHVLSSPFRAHLPPLVEPEVDMSAEIYVAEFRMSQ